MRLQKNAKQVYQYLGILYGVILSCFVVCNGAWGICRCLIRQSSMVAEDSVLFIAVTVAGRIGGLSALNVSCWVSVTSHCCSLCNHKLDMNQLGNGKRATVGKQPFPATSCCSGDSNQDVQDKNLARSLICTLNKSILCHKFG